MGVCYSVELVDPDVFGRVNRLLDGRSAITSDILNSLFAELGRTPSEDILVELASEEPIDESTVKAAYDELITFRSVWLDKSLSLGLEKVLRLVPEFRVLKHMFLEFGGFDFEPPKCVPTLDFGVFGLWKVETLSEAGKALHRFQQFSDIDVYLTSHQFSLFDRLAGRKAKLVHALHALRSDYNWEYWATLSRTIDEAIQRQWYLGYSLR
jgi:hypothetical protein